MKPHGHYCKICGEYKANEKFSGKGHAAHIIRSNHPNSSCFGWHTPGMVSEILPFGTAAGLPRPMGFTFRFYVQY